MVRFLACDLSPEQKRNKGRSIKGHPLGLRKVITIPPVGKRAAKGVVESNINGRTRGRGERASPPLPRASAWPRRRRA